MYPPCNMTATAQKVKWTHGVVIKVYGSWPMLSNKPRSTIMVMSQMLSDSNLHISDFFNLLRSEQNSPHLQTKFPYALLWMKHIVFLLKFHWIWGCHCQYVCIIFSNGLASNRKWPSFMTHVCVNKASAIILTPCFIVWRIRTQIYQLYAFHNLH